MVLGHSTFVVCWFKKKERYRKQKSFVYGAEALSTAF